MENQNSQKGAALIVVLSLLTISLMVGLSSMQSSQIDERLAGNYKAQSEAQMGAEEAASAGWENIVKVEGSDWMNISDLSNSGFDDISWSGFKGSANSGGCSSPVSCYYEYVVDGDDKYIVAIGGVDDGGVSISEPVVVKVAYASLPELTYIDSAVFCSGEDCFYTPGSGKASPSVDGTNRFKDGKTQGSHAPEEDVRWPNGAGIVMPEIASSDAVGDFGGGYVGAPGEVYNKDSFENDIATVLARGETWEQAKQRVKIYIANFIKFSESDAEGDGFYYAGPEKTVTPGSAEGVVFVDGGTLSLGGKDAFRGLVIMNGGEILSSGTPAIVGAVIGENFTFSGNGTPSIYYSLESVNSSQDVKIEGGDPEILDWR